MSFQADDIMPPAQLVSTPMPDPGIFKAKSLVQRQASGVGQGDYPISVVVAQLLGKGQEAGIEARANSPVLKPLLNIDRGLHIPVIGCPLSKGGKIGISGNLATEGTSYSKVTAVSVT